MSISISTHCWILFCFCMLASHTTYSFLLTQSLGLTHVSVGGTVQLRCTFEHKYSYYYTDATWLKLNLQTGKLTSVRSGSQSDFLQNDDKTYIVTLTNVTQKDSGLYYCITRYNSMAIFGSGSRVIVTDHAGVEPQLSILYSPPETSSSLVLLQCLVSGVVPSQMRVFWMIGEKTHIGWTESAWTDATDSATEFTRAHLSIPAEEWTETDEIQCFAEYNGKNITQTLKRCETKPTCSWLLYAGCVAALLTILLTIIMSVVLYRDMLVNKKNRGLTRKDAHRKILYGNQSTLREESSSVMVRGTENCEDGN